MPVHAGTHWYNVIHVGLSFYRVIIMPYRHFTGCGRKQANLLVSYRAGVYPILYFLPAPVGNKTRRG